MRVPPLAQPEAIALLTERAAVVLPGFTIDSSNAEAAERLCRRLDRIPLALELAAVRLEGLTLEQLVAGLERDLPCSRVGTAARRRGNRRSKRRSGGATGC